MRPGLNHLSAALFLACLGLASVSAAQSDGAYGAKVTVRQISNCVWSFTIYNTSTSPDYWISLITFETCAAITTPAGWEADWNWRNGRHWMNSPPYGGPAVNSWVMAPGRGIEPGGRVGGFLFNYGTPTTFHYLRYEDHWWAWFWCDSDAVCTGHLELAVDAVPEPASLSCLGFAICAMGALTSARRRRTDPSDVSPAS